MAEKVKNKAMTQEEQRELAIQKVAGLLRTTPFSMEFKVVKKPKGIRIIYELTQEEMDELAGLTFGSRDDEIRNI